MDTEIERPLLECQYSIGWRMVGNSARFTFATQGRNAVASRQLWAGYAMVPDRGPPARQTEKDHD